MATHTDLIEAFKRLTAALRPLDDTDDGMAKADAHRDRVIAYVDAITAQIVGAPAVKCPAHRLVAPCTGCAGDRLAADVEPAINPSNARTDELHPAAAKALTHTRRAA